MIIFLVFVFQVISAFNYYEEDKESYNQFLQEIQDVYNQSNLQNYSTYFIEQDKFYLDPCQNYGSFKECKNELLQNSDLITQNWILDSSKLISVFYITEIYSYACSDEFMIKDSCGTFFEIHQHLNENILYLKRITEALEPNQQNFQIFNMQNFCTGFYEIWFTIKARNKKFIQKILPFYLVGNCQLILNQIQLMQRYIPLQKINDDIRYGDGIILYNQSNQKDLIFMKNIICENESQLNKLFNTFQLLQNNPIQNFVEVKKVSKDTDQHMLKVCFQFYDEILNIKNLNIVQLIHLFNSGLQFLMFLKNNGLIHGNLRPECFVKFKEDNFKVGFRNSMGQKEVIESLIDNIKDQKTLFCSPKVFNKLLQNDLEKYSEKDDLFSLGLICLLFYEDKETYESFFSYEQKKFDFKYFQTKLNYIEQRNYDDLTLLFFKFIKQYIFCKEQERLTLYQTQIMLKRIPQFKDMLQMQNEQLTEKEFQLIKNIPVVQIDKKNNNLNYYNPLEFAKNQGELVLSQSHDKSFEGDDRKRQETLVNLNSQVKFRKEFANNLIMVTDQKDVINHQENEAVDQQDILEKEKFQNFDFDMPNPVPVNYLQREEMFGEINLDFLNQRQNSNSKRNTKSHQNKHMRENSIDKAYQIFRNRSKKRERSQISNSIKICQQSSLDKRMRKHRLKEDSFKLISQTKINDSKNRQLSKKKFLAPRDFLKQIREKEDNIKLNKNIRENFDYSQFKQKLKEYKKNYDKSDFKKTVKRSTTQNINMNNQIKNDKPIENSLVNRNSSIDKKFTYFGIQNPIQSNQSIQSNNLNRGSSQHITNFSYHKKTISQPRITHKIISESEYFSLLQQQRQITLHIKEILVVYKIFKEYHIVIQKEIV